MMSLRVGTMQYEDVVSSIIKYTIIEKARGRETILEIIGKASRER